MKAFVNEKYGLPSTLKLKEVNKPTPKDDEVLIKVHSVGVNQADWHILTADIFLVRLAVGFTAPKYKILGADVAGVVESMGIGVKKFKKGDKVFGDASQTFGGFAEYVSVNKKYLLPIPKKVSFEISASVPMAGVTALQALKKAKSQKGDKILIIGASGGVGHFAVQIAKAMGAHVTAVVSTRNIKLAKTIGADKVIDYTKEDFTKQGELYDVILMAGGHYSIFDIKRILAPKGRYVMVGGNNVAGFLEAMILGPILSMTGSKKLSNILAVPSAEDLEFVKKLLENGKVKPVIDKRFTFKDIPQAMRYIGEGHTQGKTVIKVRA